MNQVQPQGSIRDIRQRHGVTSQVLAEKAGVPLRIPYLMEIGCPVSQNDAAKVLRALSVLTKDNSLANAQPKAALRPL